uniref:Secreted protein n=1 Tax=Oreochromis aureus TaxID=47969 RepID=A0AAZ1XCT2_OREAU
MYHCCILKTNVHLFTLFFEAVQLLKVTRDSTDTEARERIKYRVILPVFLLGSATLCRRSKMGSWRPSSSMMDTVTVEDWIGSPSSLISIRTRLVLTSPVYRLTVKRESQALWPESASTAVTLVTR